MKCLCLSCVYFVFERNVCQAAITEINVQCILCHTILQKQMFCFALILLSHILPRTRLLFDQFSSGAEILFVVVDEQVRWRGWVANGSSICWYYTAVESDLNTIWTNWIRRWWLWARQIDKYTRIFSHIFLWGASWAMIFSHVHLWYDSIVNDKWFSGATVCHWNMCVWGVERPEGSHKWASCISHTLCAMPPWASHFN